MNRTFTLLLFIALIFSAKAQQAIHAAQPYGKVDTADLKLTSCDFEKDANAEVLFDKAVVTCYDNGYITYLRHKRIKIFNDNGKDEANIKIGFIDKITDIEAETINITGKTIEYTPVDTKLIYQEKIDKHQKALIFTFPDVRPGSIIELQYKWKIFSDFVPAWYFQSNIPTRYSENEITLPAQAILINTVAKVTQPFAKDSDITIGTKGHLKCTLL
jgi:hypothetical protein